MPGKDQVLVVYLVDVSKCLNVTIRRLLFQSRKQGSAELHREQRVKLYCPQLFVPALLCCGSAMRESSCEMKHILTFRWKFKLLPQKLAACFVFFFKDDDKKRFLQSRHFAHDQSNPQFTPDASVFCLHSVPAAELASMCVFTLGVDAARPCPVFLLDAKRFS